MQPKHTSGPWRLIPPGEATPSPMYMGTVAIVAHSPSLYVVLDVGHPHTRVLPEEWEPNAHLISAAPAMYHALRAARLWLATGIEPTPDRAHLLAGIDAALRKADGDAA